MKEEVQRRRTRISGLTAAISALFALVAVRLGLLVLLDGPRLASMARNEHQGAIELAAVRGPIFDRNGKPLALSAATKSIYARPRTLLEASTPEERVRLARELGMTPAALEARLARKSSFVWLARHLEPERARELELTGPDGLGSVPEDQRYYPERGLAAAAVGMAGEDGQGLSGVELGYDRMVRGEPVELRFYHDALGHPILDSPVALRGAEPGARLELTIDSTIQAQAENYLAAKLTDSGARRGAAVVLDPFTGEVLALADVSAGDPPGGDRLHDAAVQDAFEPGSTMKGLLGAIALDDQVIDTRRRLYCENGQWSFAGKQIHDDSPHGWLDLGGIIEVSSNIGAAKIALTMGARRFQAGLAGFGLGRKTGIDLPGEASGLMRPAERWRPLDLANHGFGQGIAVTPIQLATAYAAIANGGVVMRPYLVRAAYDGDGRKLFARTPQMLRRAVTPATAHQMNLLLRAVVNAPDGTGRLAQVADFTVAGKTGTAQMVNPATGSYYQNRLVASFVGFVPAQDPRLVILVVLYDVPHAHFGGLFAAPVFSAIASDALRHLGVTPERPAYASAGVLPFGSLSSGRPVATDGASSGVADDEDRTALAGAPPAVAADGASSDASIPDFTGLSLRRALMLARVHGLNLESSGAGYVIAQEPAPATPAKGLVKLQLAADTDRAPGVIEPLAGGSPPP